MSDITTKQARLEALEAQFEAQGGRGVELAEEIDTLRAELEGNQFYRTVITVEVLTNEPFFFENLADVHYAVTEGHASGTFFVESEETVTEETMRELLIAQGSDPEFLS